MTLVKRYMSYSNLSGYDDDDDYELFLLYFSENLYLSHQSLLASFAIESCVSLELLKRSIDLTAVLNELLHVAIAVQLSSRANGANHCCG